MTKVFILVEQDQFGQKQLSVQQHRCVALAEWVIKSSSSDKCQAP